MRFTSRMLLRSILVRRSRSLTALAAVTIAATVATALLNLYFDTQSKLTHEFRGYGANVVLHTDVSFQIQPAWALAKTIYVPAWVRQVLQPDERVVPLAYATAMDATGRPVVIAGTDIAALRDMNRFWKSEEVLGSPDAAIIGKRVYTQGGWQSISGNDVTLELKGGTVITSGDADDSRIFVSLDQFHSLAPRAYVRTLLVSIPGDSDHVMQRVMQLRTQLPDVGVEPVRQIVATQASVLTRMRSVLLLSTALIAVIAALSLLASLSASVLERRRDFAVFKALGASQRSVSRMFLLESLAIGVAGSLLGYLLGCAISALIGYINFHSVVRPRLTVLPWIAAGSLLITLLGALLPLQRLQKIQPAAMLKGD